MKKADKKDKKEVLTGSPGAEAKGEPKVVSAGLGPFEILEGNNY